MPYICLARGDLPDGTVQVLDLYSNESQRNLIYDPPGQTRYVNRVQSNRVFFTAVGVTTGNTDGLKAYLVDRVEPIPASIGGDEWTAANQETIAAALIARVDAGLSLTRNAVNGVIQSVFPASDLTGAGTNSTGVLTELLSIMAGRGYRLGATFTKGPGGVWDATQQGAFTYNVLVNDTQMVAGELRPVTIGGDAQAREVKPIRQTIETGQFLLSLSQGALRVLGARTGAPAVTLWPDSDPLPHYPWTYQPALTYPAVSNARIVTVYDDDGTVLTT